MAPQSQNGQPNSHSSCPIQAGSNQSHNGFHVDCLYCQAEAYLKELALLVAVEEAEPEHFTAAEGLLAALPLASHEHGIAMNRLANAARYFVQGEFGAALYELRLLKRSFAPAAVVERPRNRRHLQPDTQQQQSPARK